MRSSVNTPNRDARAVNIANSGTSIEESIATPPFLSTLAGWCRVDHMSTENFTIGTFMALNTANKAAALEALAWSSNAFHKHEYPKYKKSRSNIEVSRASHTHQAPHVYLPHTLPVTKHTMVKHPPTGAIALDSKKPAFFLISATKLNTATAAYVPNEIHAEGTCKYIMRTTSPCL